MPNYQHNGALHLRDFNVYCAECGIVSEVLIGNVRDEEEAKEEYFTIHRTNSISCTPSRQNLVATGVAKAWD